MLAPALALGLFTLGALAMIFLWSRDDPHAAASWRWGDAPRRPGAGDGLLGHVFGAAIVALAVGYALNHPLCG